MSAGVVLRIARKDLVERLRDRSAVVLGFVAPLVIATVMSFAFRGAGSYHADVAVVDHDRGTLAVAFRAMLDSPELVGIISVRRVSDEAAARREVRDGTLGAAFVLPAGLTAGAHGGRTGDIVVLGSVDASIARQVADALVQGFVAQVNADHLAVATAVASGADARRIGELAAQSARLRLPVTVSTRTTGATRIAAISYFGPSMGIFFMFFAIGLGARSWFVERRSGTLDRIAAAPVPAWALLVGKSVSTFGFGVASLSMMAVVTSVVFGADWGPPVAAAALIVAVVLSAVALTALVIAVARSDRQADGLASTVTFVLVLAGGNFVFVSAAPTLLRRLALLTPNGWAMRGFVDLSGGAGASAAIVPVLAILAFTAVVTAPAVLLARRAVTS
ncbi:MAG: ABC transporter permease [Jatrophihabitans sp.]|uniref:ABC transporter permease n=1 Tax=Jatrophihabitans sp. TaxID=1932789 RepID=UPI003F81F785